MHVCSSKGECRLLPRHESFAIIDSANRLVSNHSTTAFSEQLTCRGNNLRESSIIGTEVVFACYPGLLHAVLKFPVDELK